MLQFTACQKYETQLNIQRAVKHYFMLRLAEEFLVGLEDSLVVAQLVPELISLSR